MQDPGTLTKIVNRKRYSVTSATMLASSDTTGRTVYLYRTPTGSLFFAHITIWQDEKDTIVPTNYTEALHFYENAQVQHINFALAFPLVEITYA
jgi:hypothetical protein